MIVSDVIMRVRRIFGDEAAVQVTDADVIRWINDGQVEIVKNNEAALQTTGFINLVANQATYDLPADYFILRSLRYKFSDMLSYRVLRYKNMQEFDDSIDGWDGTLFGPSSPVFFTVYEGKATLFPIPDRAMTAGLKVLYNKKPTDVVGTSDALSLPLIYHNTIVRYCLQEASLMDEDLEPAQLYRADFQADMSALSNNETSDPVDKYPTITVLEFDR